MNDSTRLGGPTPEKSKSSLMLERSFGLMRVGVELGVVSSFLFSLALFVAASVQAFRTIWEAAIHLGTAGTAKRLMIAAVEQTDVLLVGLALLIISIGMHTLFVGPLQSVPTALQIQTFDELKQRLIGIVAVALIVNFFSVALQWKGGADIFTYGAAVAFVILVAGTYSRILSRDAAERQAELNALKDDLP